MHRPRPGKHATKASNERKKTTDGKPLTPPPPPPFSCVDELTEIQNLSLKVDALMYFVDENMGDSLRLQDDHAARFGEMVDLLTTEFRKLHDRISAALDRAMKHHAK